MKKFEMIPIGYVKCPEPIVSNRPRGKNDRKKYKAEAIINENLEKALDGIEQFDRVWFIFVFDQNIGKRYDLKLVPHPDPYQREHGLFVTRSPNRPNPIGLSCVRVLGRNKNILYFENTDLLDGTPLLDIKPYIPNSDSHPDSKAGWLDDIKDLKLLD